MIQPTTGFSISQSARIASSQTINVFMDGCKTTLLLFVCGLGCCRLYGPYLVWCWPVTRTLEAASHLLRLLSYLTIANMNHCIIVCWFASDRTRLLVNFIPRWIIILIIIALYLRLTYILLRIQKQLESTEEDTTIILSGHHHMSRHIDLQQKDPQTNSYPHTSDSRSATANVQRSGPTSKLKKVRTSIMGHLPIGNPN